MKKSLKIKIFGKVIGVNFRYYTKKKAGELGLGGYVYNSGDSSVMILAAGEKEKLKHLLDWCRQGPSRAVVDKIEFKWGDFNPKFINFDIKY